MIRIFTEFNTYSQQDEIILREQKHMNLNPGSWKQKECAPYQLPDGTLIPVFWQYPEYLEVTLTVDSPSEPLG